MPKIYHFVSYYILFWRQIIKYSLIHKVSTSFCFHFDYNAILIYLFGKIKHLGNYFRCF